MDNTIYRIDKDFKKLLPIGVFFVALSPIITVIGLALCLNH